MRRDKSYLAGLVQRSEGLKFRGFARVRHLELRSNPVSEKITDIWIKRGSEVDPAFEATCHIWFSAATDAVAQQPSFPFLQEGRARTAFVSGSYQTCLERQRAAPENASLSTPEIGACASAMGGH